MTAYELIQRLAKYDADADVEIRFTTSNSTVTCDACEDEVFVDGEEKSSTNIEIGDNGSIYLVYLNCMEE